MVDMDEMFRVCNFIINTMDEDDGFVSYSDLLGREKSAGDTQENPNDVTKSDSARSQAASNTTNGATETATTSNIETATTSNTETATEAAATKTASDHGNTRNSVPVDNPGPEGAGSDLLLEKQTVKVGLLKQRSSLVSKRDHLLSEINARKRQAKKLNERKNQIIADRTLEALIQRNNSDFAPDVVKKLRLHVSSEKDDSLSILNKLDVSPSDDWVKRLEYIGMFYYNVTITNASVKTVTEHESMIRIYTFTIIAEQVFRFPITLRVDATGHSILNIDVSKSSKRPSGPLRSISSLCPTFHKVLVDDYLPTKKLNLIMYGLNSLSAQVNKRVMLLLQIINKFKQYLIPTYSLQEFVTSPSGVTENQLKVTSTLKGIDKLEFLIPRSASYDEQKVTFNYQIFLKDAITSDCAASITVDIGSSGMVKDVTFLYLELAKTHGTLEGLVKLFALLFQINLD